MTHQTYVGIYWTRPVPRAGFVSLSADVDVAASESLTILYQRDLARRHVRSARGVMNREMALLELAPDRASREAVMAVERLVEMSADDAIFLTVDFSHEVNWRPHRFLWAALPVERREALAPDPILIEGKAFNPRLHFRAWQCEGEAHRAGKDNHRSLLLAALAGREDRSWTEKANHLNGLDLCTHGGKRWTADNLRKFIGPASGGGGPDEVLRT